MSRATNGKARDRSAGGEALLLRDACILAPYSLHRGARTLVQRRNSSRIVKIETMNPVVVATIV